MTLWPTSPSPRLEGADAPDVRRLTLTHPAEPSRRIGVRVEGERGGAPQPYVVLCHGFKGFMDWGFFPALSRALSGAGYVAVSMNASGSGVGDNPLEMDDEEAFFRDTYGRQLEDITAVRAFARGLESVDAGREALLGHSRGGGVMLLAAAEEAPAAVVLWAAIDDADRFDDAAKAHWRAEGELRVPNGRTGQVHRMSVAALDEFEGDPARFDMLAAAGRIDAPLLALHGTEDPTVDPGAAERIAARAPAGTAQLFPGADHAFGARHPCPDPSTIPSLAGAIDATVRFLGAHVPR